MQFTVLSLFPEQVEANVRFSISGRALEKGLFNFNALNIRDFADNSYGKIDDTIYGGGKGMLLQPEPVYQAWKTAQNPKVQHARTIYLSPKGKPLTQTLVRELAKEEQLILLCGHYEGIDGRVLEKLNAEEISLGDYVLTGGELAASVLIDAVARLLPGVLPSEEVFEDESHSKAWLECRHFTKPAVWEKLSVPAVLQSGHHENIAQWRHFDGLAETQKKRPDLFDALSLSAKEHAKLIVHIKDEYNNE